MKKLALALFTVFAFASQSSAQDGDVRRWEQQARNVTIARDDGGLAHVHGKTDPDVFFGMIYAQEKEDFNRVKKNFINPRGRLGKTEGESAIWRDLKMKIFIDPADMKAKYES